VANTKADWAVAAARRNHLPFYRRVLKLERASDGRVYPGLLCPMYLMTCDFKANIAGVLESTPELRPTGYEQNFLDERQQESWEIGFPVEQ
jgi:hypothetical protein